MNAVITGASRGMGKAIAQIFATHGYNLFLCSKSEESLLPTVEEFQNDFPNVNIEGKAIDVGKKEGAGVFADWVLNKTDRVDVLVNNVGTYIPGNVSDEEDGVLEKMLEVNLYSTYHTTRALLPAIKKRKRSYF